MEFSWDLWKSDTKEDGDERTATVLATIANSIDSNIQVTTDWPSKHPSGRMPVLDLELWIDYYEGIPKVEYTIMKRSAVSTNTKMNTIFQETIRRILNVSDHLPWEETVRSLNKWSNCLRISGYTPQKRFNTIRGAIQRVEEMKRKVRDV